MMIRFCTFMSRRASRFAALAPVKECLLIDTNSTTSGGGGWEEFGYRVNYGKQDGTALLETSGGGGNWHARSRVRCCIKGNEMELAVARKAVGTDGISRPLRFDFKWMDNVSADKDPLNLYRNGDTAPNGRFRYQYGVEAASRK